MKHAPWRRISTWDCIACGQCCRQYTVNISFREWVRIVKRFGVEVARAGLSEFYLRKRLDGRCVFQYQIPGSYWLCGLQHIKPKVCKLWPFKILSKPIYGREEEALYLSDSKPYYIYVDPNCRGIFRGRPGQKLIQKTIPEFIQLAYGKSDRQKYSTSQYMFNLHQIIQV